MFVIPLTLDLRPNGIVISANALTCNGPSSSVNNVSTQGNIMLEKSILQTANNIGSGTG